MQVSVAACDSGERRYALLRCPRNKRHMNVRLTDCIVSIELFALPRSVFNRCASSEVGQTRGCSEKPTIVCVDFGHVLLSVIYCEQAGAWVGVFCSPLDSSFLHDK